MLLPDIKEYLCFCTLILPKLKINYHLNKKKIFVLLFSMNDLHHEFIYGNKFKFDNKKIIQIRCYTIFLKKKKHQCVFTMINVKKITWYSLLILRVIKLLLLNWYKCWYLHVFIEILSQSKKTNNQ